MSPTTYSQPANDEEEHADGSGFDVTLSLVASYAHLLGDRDGVRDQLASEADREVFDRAYQVQADRDGMEKEGENRRIKDREKQKRRAEKEAKEELAEEERQALFSASNSDPFQLLDSADLDDLPEADVLIEGFLVKESLVRLYGPPKHFKSFVMLDMAGCVGSGIQWCGRKTTPARVLYVVAEGVRGIKRRVRAWEAQNKRPMTGVHFYPNAVQLGNKKDVQALIATAKLGGYEFIVLDTQARCTVGLEENSASEMGVVVAALDVLKEVTGACVALVHHSGASGGRARGSTAILGALDAEFEVKADKDTMSVELITKAQKDLAEAPIMEMDLVTPGPGHALAVKARPAGTWYQGTPADAAPLSDQQERVLKALAEFQSVGASPSAVTSEMGWDAKQRSTVQKVMGRLVEKGYIHRENGNRYVVTRQGRSKLEWLSRQLPDH